MGPQRELINLRTYKHTAYYRTKTLQFAL
uniref:Uncharacterized protein n=1 Tax=Anguilla anguilla TaxID=7936 RepID=A0A0E9SKW8_ANGAN